MSSHDMERFEKNIRKLAAEFPYPETSDLRGPVWERTIEGPQVLSPRAAITYLTVIIALVVVFLLAAVPGVRAAVFEYVDIGSVRILFGGEAPTEPADESALEAAPTPVLNILDQLEGETSLLQAQAEAEFVISLPQYPTDLGTPDHVFLQQAGGGMVLLVWMEPGNPEAVRMSLHILSENSLVLKHAPQVIEEAQVDDQRAYWAEGPYIVEFEDGGFQPARLMSGHVLIWHEEGLTYRLETDLPQAEVVLIAESLKVMEP